LALLRGPEAYELALVDLDLGGRDGKAGGELLDLLRVDFPATRRVIITAVPPAGDLRSRIYERYEVQDIIIKDKTTLPDLQLVVRRALKSQADQIPRHVNLQASELREHYRDWCNAAKEEIRALVSEAEKRAIYSGVTPEQPPDAARTALEKCRALQERLKTECSRLDGLIAEVRDSDDVDAVAEQLEQAMSRFAEEMRLL
jgi:hypothetical protein